MLPLKITGTVKKPTVAEALRRLNNGENTANERRENSEIPSLIKFSYTGAP